MRVIKVKKEWEKALRVEGTKMRKKGQEYLEGCPQFSVAEALNVRQREEGHKAGEESCV